MAITVLIKIFEMFVIFFCGILVYKVKLIDSSAVTKMSNLLLMVISPLLVFESYQVDFNTELLQGLLWTLFASVLTYILTIILSELIFRQKNPRTPVEKAACVYSNCAFFGIPLINSILGQEGVFYITAFSTVFNLVLWTHGVLIMDRNAAKGGISLSNLRNLINPAIIAVVAGLFCFVLQIRLPEILNEPLTMIADMNTPIAMIIAGANLAQSDFLHSLKNKRLYFISFLKLIAFPAACLVILKLLPLTFPVAFTTFIAVACPTATTTVMFADRYDQDAPFASELFVLTTLLSAVTIPLLSILAEQVLR